MIYLDTHVAAWLHAAGAELLSEEAVRQIEQAEEIRISPMVRLELQYLYEIGRVAVQKHILAEPEDVVVEVQIGSGGAIAFEG